MKPTANLRHLLREYLLGRLNASAQEQQRALAESFYEDDERYEELSSVEDELLDQYVRGELSLEDRAGFTSYLAHLPKEMAREKVAFAQALSQVAARHNQSKQPENVLFGATTALTAAASSAASSEPVWLAFSKPLMWRYSLVAVMLLLGIALVGLFFYSHRLQQTTKQLQASLDQRTQEQKESQQMLQSQQQQSAAQRQEKERLQVDLKRAQEQNEAQVQQLARLQSAFPSSSSLIHSNDARRALRSRDEKGTLPSKVTLRAGSQTVRLNLQIPRGETYQMIRAWLSETKTQKVVWKAVCEPACVPMIINNSLILQLPAGHLTAGRYTLSLTLQAADGLIVPKEYDFTIVKP